MASWSRLAIVALVLGSVLVAGCSGGTKPLPPEWKGRDLDQPGWTNQTIRVGWTFALEYVWSSGTSVQWDWLTNGTAVAYFQIVRMQNNQPVTLVGQHRDQSQGRLTVPEGGAYQMLFRNEDQTDFHVWFQVPEGYAARLYPPGGGPGCFLSLPGAPPRC